MRKEKGELARTLHCLAEVLVKDNRWEDAEPVLAEGIQVRKEHSKNDKFQYSRMLDFYVMALTRHGKTDLMIATLRDHIPELDLHSSPDAEYHFRQARRRGRLCMLLADQPADMPYQVELAKAMNSLQKAVHAGFRDSRALNSDPHLAPLRALPEFASLMEKK